MQNLALAFIICLFSIKFWIGLRYPTAQSTAPEHYHQSGPWKSSAARSERIGDLHRWISIHVENMRNWRCGCGMVLTVVIFCMDTYRWMHESIGTQHRSSAAVLENGFDSKSQRGLLGCHMRKSRAIQLYECTINSSSTPPTFIFYNKCLKWFFILSS